MSISFDALPALPPLFLDYIRNSGAASSFLPARPDLDTVERFARERVRLPRENRERLAEVLSAQQSRWTDRPGGIGGLREGAVAVVTGQQAGLFTGTLLALFKALTAIKLARELERRGTPAVPVFWIASDDHDVAEISSTGIVNQNSMFQRVTARFEVPHGETDGETVGRPVAWLECGEGIVGTIEECFTALPPSEWHEEVRAIVSSAYRPAASPVTAFAAMMLRLFAGTGLVMVDPMDPAFRDLSVDALAQGLRERDRVREAVLDRTRRIRESGYPEQVRVDDSFTGLFVLSDGERQPFTRGNGNEPLPSALSPNVLLRPFVQDSVFPTAAYVAGPAEIAYFAQAAAVYEALGRELPPLWPRITATLIEPPVSRIMRKHGLDLEDIFSGTDHLRDRVLGQSGDGRRFDGLVAEVLGRAEQLRPLVTGADETLGGALDNTVRKIERQLDTLRSRFLSARSRRDALLEGQLASLGERLFPNQSLQERSLNVTSFLVRYGTGLMSWLDERLALEGAVHQVIEL